MISQFSSFKDKTVLDIGCGSGFYVNYALEKGASVTAIDASQLTIDRLSKRIPSRKLRLICADAAEPMPFLDSNSFDYIICSLIIHYIKDWEPLLTELYRAMKPGGMLFISTHHPYMALDPDLKHVSYFDTELVEDTWGKKDKPFMVHYFTRSLTNTLKPFIDSQFKIISIEEPRPTEKCRQLSPKTYEMLNREPGFLFITLRK